MHVRVLDRAGKGVSDPPGSAVIIIVVIVILVAECGIMSFVSDVLA